MLVEPMMIDDFDGALEMDVDGPLIEIALEVVTLVLHACWWLVLMMHMMMITWSWLWSHTYCLDELLMTMEIEPLLYDVAPDVDGVSFGPVDDWWW